MRGLFRKHRRTCPGCKAPTGRADATRLQVLLPRGRPARSRRQAPVAEAARDAAAPHRPAERSRRAAPARPDLGRRARPPAHHAAEVPHARGLPQGPGHRSEHGVRRL